MASKRAADMSVKARDIFKWRRNLRNQLEDLLGYTAPIPDQLLPPLDDYLSAGPWEPLPDIRAEAAFRLYKELGPDPGSRRDYLSVRGEALTSRDLELEARKVEEPDISELFIAHLWDVVRQRARTKKRSDPEVIENPPDPEIVAHLVQLSPIPLDLRKFVAAMLRGEVKQKRGRKKRQREHDDFRVLVHRVRRWERVFEDPRYKRERLRKHQRTVGARATPPKESGPYKRALERVARETGISEDTLDKWCNPRTTPPQP